MIRLIPPVAVPVGLGQVAASVLDPRPCSSVGFADALARSASASGVSLFGSGRAALSALLAAWRSDGRDEVLLPAYTCWSVPAAVVRSGLKVRLVDVDPHTLDIEPSELERTPTRRLVAAVGTHLCGPTADVAGLRRQLHLRDPDVRVVEDAAQTWPDRGPSPADAVLLSFGRGKPLPLGGGGALLRPRTDDGARSTGPAEGGWTHAGILLVTALLARPWWYRLPASLPFLGLGATVYDPEFDAGRPFYRWQERLGQRLLLRLPLLTRRREENARRLVERIHGRHGWTVPTRTRGAGPARLAVLAPSRTLRDGAVVALERAGVAARPMYPAPLSDVAALAPALVDPGERLPGARDVADRLLTLPVYPTLSPTQVERIADAVERVVEDRG